LLFYRSANDLNGIHREPATPSPPSYIAIVQFNRTKLAAANVAIWNHRAIAFALTPFGYPVKVSNTPKCGNA
jgi:hypothetical protein